MQSRVSAFIYRDRTPKLGMILSRTNDYNLVPKLKVSRLLFLSYSLCLPSQGVSIHIPHEDRT